MCLGVKSFALAMNVEFRKLGCFEWRWLGDIYSLQPLPSRWLKLLSMAHQTVQWCIGQGTVHCPVRVTSARRWGLERLTVGVLCAVVAPDSSVAHRTCPVRSDFAAWHLTSALCAFTVHAVDTVMTSDFSTERQVTVAPLVHRTCPVIYSGASFGKSPRVTYSSGARPGAPDTVQCATGSTPSSLCSKLIWVPNLISFLVYVEPYAPEIKDI
jgi:hypothetical protein